MGAAFDPANNEGQEGVSTTDSLRKDNQLYQFLVKCNVPKVDQVFEALTKSDVMKTDDLLELTENNIKDICKEFKLSIMARRKLLNARQELLDNANKNSDDRESKSSGVIIVLVSDEETKLAKI